VRIGIIGSGTLGSALGGLFARHGHEVLLGSRRPKPARAAEIGARETCSYRDALARSEIAFLCVPGDHVTSALAQCAPFAGRILVDCSNPETADGRHLALGFDTSGAEEIARLAAGAAVLKAFNHIYAEFLQDDSLLDRDRPSVLYCGDDAHAKRLLDGLLRSCGLDVVDCGPLVHARYLEPLAMLMVHLVREQGFGPTGIVLRLMRTAEQPLAA